MAETKFGFPSSGDDWLDEQEARSILRSAYLRSIGRCPNDAEVLVLDVTSDPTRTCYRCGFAESYFGKQPEAALREGA